MRRDVVSEATNRLHSHSPFLSHNVLAVVIDCVKTMISFN